MIAIAIWANLLVAYTTRHTQVGRRVMILPLVIAVAFFLFADIDAPRRGVIRVLPQNLISLAQSLKGQ
jgi:predicted PurR-regulated permease PerM